MAAEAQITGNTGLHYVCYRLSRVGWNVMSTARNARGIDIVAYDRTATRFVGIQVKSLSKRSPVPLGTDLDRILEDFWIIVNALSKDRNAFVLLPSEVRARAHRGEKDGRISYWLQPTSYDTLEFREAWARIETSRM